MKQKEKKRKEKSLSSHVINKFLKRRVMYEWKSIRAMICMAWFIMMNQARIFQRPSFGEFLGRSEGKSNTKRCFQISVNLKSRWLVWSNNYD